MRISKLTGYLVVDSGMTAAAFGAVAGIGALFFLEGVPRVRRDILQKLPTLGEYWDREIPPSDNVRFPLPLLHFPHSISLLTFSCVALLNGNQAL